MTPIPLTLYIDCAMESSPEHGAEMSLRNVLNMVARILAPVSELTNSASFTAESNSCRYSSCNSCFFFPCDLYPPQQVALNVLGQRLPTPASFTEVGTVATMAFSRLTRGTRDDCCTTGSWKNMRTLLCRHYSHCVGFYWMYHVYRFTMFVDRDFVDIPSIRSMNVFFLVLFAKGAFLCCADALLCYGSGPRSKVGWDESAVGPLLG